MSKSTFYTGLRAFCSTTFQLGDKFHRSALWSPRHLMVGLLLLTHPGHSMSYRATLSMLDRFGGRLLQWSHTPSIGSMSKARRKLSAEVCRSYLHSFSDRCTRTLVRARHVWRGRRIIAIDGTTVVANRSADTLKHLKCPSGGHGTSAHHPRGLVVLAVDVMRRLPLDWCLGRKGEGETTIVQRMLEHLQPGAVVVVDRGYPSRYLFRKLVEHGVDVVIRITADKAVAWKEFKPFLASGKKSAVITVALGKHKTAATVRCRLVERNRQRGRPRTGTKKERMVILTTLREEDGFTRDELIKVYAARWGVETLIREIKSFIKLEPMHTKTTLGIEQEIAASLIWMALASLLESAAQDEVAEGRRILRSDCYRYASVLLAEYLIGKPIQQDIDYFIQELKKHSYKPKPGRYAERKCHVPYGRSWERFSS